jgi:hypothetical protein
MEDDNKWGNIGTLRFLLSQDPVIDQKINCANGKHSHMGVCTMKGYFDMCSECGIDMTHLMDWKVVPQKKRRMKIARKFRIKGK